MDLRTGRTFASLEEALKAGVPESDVVRVTPRTGSAPRLVFSKGSFKPARREGARINTRPR